MQVIIFGATGMVGKELVNQSLYKGYRVKAYGRNVFTAGLPEKQELELVQGALFDEKQVLEAIRGCDAVLSSLGGGVGGADFTRSLGMKNIVAQMQQAGVHRIMAVGGKGTLLVNDDELLMEQPDYPQQFLPVSHEHLKAYEILKASNLQWTVVCPPDIINAAATGEFITAANYPPSPDTNRITAGDLALFMLGELTNNEYVQQRVGISAR